MSVTTNTGFDDQAASGIYTPINLVKYEFRDGDLFLTNYPIDQVAFGETFVGLARFYMDELVESEDGASQKNTHYLDAQSDSLLALTMGDPGQYEDKPVTVWVAMLNPDNGRMQGLPVKRFAGFMDSVKPNREKGRVELVCRSASYDAGSDPQSLRYSDGQQRLLYPTDDGMAQIPTLINKPLPWLSVKFQTIR